jgi:hypothetical protein
MAEKKCTAAVRAGRLSKAREFRLAAELLEERASGQDDLADAYVTLCVHAGIAAADVICCRRLNVHHQGESHDEAVTLLARVDRQLAVDLATLLRKKTAAGYGERVSSRADRKQAKRAMERLVDSAEAVGAGQSSALA